MKLFGGDDEREPQQFAMQGRSGPPVDGVTLAGAAENGDRLCVLGWGSYRNDGSKARPRWVRIGQTNPLDTARSPIKWRKLSGDD